MSDEQTREVYRRARIGERFAPGERPCVLVVDFSCGFTDPSCDLGSDLTGEVEATTRVLGVARERGFPVVFTTIAFEPNLRDGALWPQKIPSLEALVKSQGIVGHHVTISDEQSLACACVVLEGRSDV